MSYRKSSLQDHFDECSSIQQQLWAIKLHYPVFIQQFIYEKIMLIVNKQLI